jgi:hypothetical protein
MDTTYLDTWQTRNSRLAKLGLTYQEYLLSAEWQQVHAKARERKTYKCCWVCSKPRTELHHRSYKWIGTKYAMRDIVPVCRGCHEGIHQFAKEHDLSVRLATTQYRNNWVRSIPEITELKTYIHQKELCDKLDSIIQICQSIKDALIPPQTTDYDEEAIERLLREIL